MAETSDRSRPPSYQSLSYTSPLEPEFQPLKNRVQDLENELNDLKKRNELSDQMTRVNENLEKLIEVTRATKHDLATIAMKTSNLEKRGCYTTPEVNARDRFLQAWIHGDEWFYSPEHIKMAYKDLEMNGLNALSYGFHMAENDERRGEVLCVFCYEKLVLKNARLEAVPLNAQIGALCIKMPSFRKLLQSEVGKDKVVALRLPDVPKCLRAMLHIVEPCDKRWQPVLRDENEKHLLVTAEDADILEEIPKDKFWDELPEIVHNMFLERKELFGHEAKDSIAFTKMLSEYFEWAMVGQSAAGAIDQNAYYERCASRLSEEAQKTKQNRLALTAKLYERYDESGGTAIKKAQRECPELFTSWLENIAGGTSYAEDVYVPDLKMVAKDVGS